MQRTTSTPVVVLLGILLLAGCANRNDRFIVDSKQVDMAQYQRDLAECEAYAGQVSVGRQAGTGAVAGAIVGGAIGAIVGDHNTAQRMAGVGGVTGTAKGTVAGVREKRAVVRNCLTGRGYRVLN